MFRAQPYGGRSRFISRGDNTPLASRPSLRAPRYGLTLVEMLIAVAITFVMMAAVVSVFAVITDSVQQRRATTEMNNSVRQARKQLQADLRGGTCRPTPWQRPESNHGYFELIEGPYCDFFPSMLTDGTTAAAIANGELDYVTSSVPSSNLLSNRISTGALPSDSVTDGRALGDSDDILMLTVRNEKEPFVGRVPSTSNNGIRDNNGNILNFGLWPNSTIRSPLAEVVWFAVENPDDDFDPLDHFGEPGFRTIYRRTLLIAPWLDPYKRVDRNGNVLESYPGVVRVLPRNLFDRDQVERALAALIAFQERYDLSVRLEWDPLLPGNGPNDLGQWKLVANSLADLTKRENRFEHHGYWYRGNPATSARTYPYAVASMGSNYTGNPQLRFEMDQELAQLYTAPTAPQGRAIKDPNNNRIQRFELPNPNQLGEGYVTRPFVYIEEASATAPAPVRALVKSGSLAEDQQVVFVTAGLVPLGGDRKGEDVMLTDALAFDLRVYDPGAPLLGPNNANMPDVVVEPGDAGWGDYLIQWNNSNNDVAVYGYGAYVDLSYLPLHSALKGAAAPIPMPTLAVTPQFAGAPRLRSGLNLWGQGGLLFEPYRVYDTWSLHYENNGLDEDGSFGVDQGTNGFDDDGLNGVDDPGERETSPPYDIPLRGVQVRLRAYERDSRQVREVSVKQHFVPE